MKRNELVYSIMEKVKEMSTQTILFHQVVASILGLHITDHKSLDIINRFGAMPAGRLGELTGLTTGAVTGIIDRLEKTGYVKRTDDPKDRRLTIIQPARNKKLDEKIDRIFIPLHNRMLKLLSLYSVSELIFLHDTLLKFLKFIQEESEKLRQEN